MRAELCADAVDTCGGGAASSTLSAGCCGRALAQAQALCLLCVIAASSVRGQADARDVPPGELASQALDDAASLCGLVLYSVLPQACSPCRAGFVRASACSHCTPDAACFPARRTSQNAARVAYAHCERTCASSRAATCLVWLDASCAAVKAGAKLRGALTAADAPPVRTCLAITDFIKISFSVHHLVCTTYTSLFGVAGVCCCPTSPTQTELLIILTCIVPTCLTTCQRDMRCCRLCSQVWNTLHWHSALHQLCARTAARHTARSRQGLVSTHCWQRLLAWAWSGWAVRSQLRQNFGICMAPHALCTHAGERCVSAVYTCR